MLQICVIHDSMFCDKCAIKHAEKCSDLKIMRQCLLLIPLVWVYVVMKVDLLILKEIKGSL